MSALKQNPFLIGFGAVMVLGVGALGYLTYTAADAHEKAAADFEKESSELKRLQGADPFPNDEHLKKFIEQRDILKGKVESLQKELAKTKIAIEPITPTGFQDRLRESVARVTARATEAQVVLPGAGGGAGGNEKDKFYLGFNIYQSEPPKTAAAPLLYRELKGIEAVMDVVLSTGAVTLKELIREELPEEKDAKPAAADSKKKDAKKADDSGRKLIEKNKFTLKLSGAPEKLQQIMKGIVGHKQQLFVIRSLNILNERLDSPPKVLAVAAPPPPPVADPNAPAAPVEPAAAPAASAQKYEYVFGKENVEVTFDLELIDIDEPAAPAAKDAKRN